MESDQIILIRPHHINCLFFFRGLGYSDEFVNEMTKIRDIILNNRSQQIKLVCGADNICNNCPNLNENNKCITEDRIKKLDENTIEVYNLVKSKVYRFSEIIDSIYDDFSESKFKDICSECQWYKQGVCSEEDIHELKKKWR